MPIVVTAGSNHHGQLGREGETSVFEKVNIESDVIQICCGAHFTVAVTSSGSVYGWGRNESGQLALPAVSIDRPTLITFSSSDRIVKVSCGESHTLFLTTSGEIYSCGEGSCGQRGDGTYRSECFEVKRVLLNESARDVFCGARTSFAITDDGDLFGWGETTSGMLGTPAWLTPTLAVPTRLSVGPPQTRIARVIASVNFAILVTTTGEILGSGSNTNGQLGITDCCTYTWRPIRDVGRVSDVACGRRLTLCHQVEKERCIVLSDQLESFTLPNLEGLAAGEDNVIAWTDGGSNFYVYGHNRYGQLGVRDTLFVEKLTKIELPIKANVVAVSCGRKHTCLLLSEESVRDMNYVVSMEDSFTAEGSIGRELHTMNDGKQTSFEWVCLGTSLAAMAIGMLLAVHHGRHQ